MISLKNRCCLIAFLLLSGCQNQNTALFDDLSALKKEFIAEVLQGSIEECPFSLSYHLRTVFYSKQVVSLFGEVHEYTHLPHGWTKYEGPKQKATVYEDQILNETALRSQKYRVWSLKIGGTPFAGIPDYFADMIGGIIGCSYLYIDGKPFTVNEGSQMEPVELEGYPMRGWGVEMRDRYTRAAITYENDDPIEGVLAVMVNVDSKGFGNSASGSQTVVLDVQ